MLFRTRHKIRITQIQSQKGKEDYMMKKVFCFILSIALVFAMSLPSYATTNSNLNVSSMDGSIDELDALLVASSFLNSEDAANDILCTNSSNNYVISLYDETGNVVAYYVTFNPTGYAVVNNNSANPTVIEFGAGKNKLIEDILSVSPNSHIIYNHPADIYSTGTNSRSKRNNANLYDYFPDLRTRNPAAIAQLQELKLLVPEVSTYGDGDYGFINWDNMPAGTHTYGLIKDAATVDWATTNEFSQIANNHCGATAVTNLALYFAKRGSTNLKVNSSVYDTFVEVHNIVGDGPKFTIADEAKEYFSDRGYTLKNSSVGSFSGIKTAVGNNRPCGILLADGIVQWHWILCVGYREYTSGGSYMRVVNGWEDTTLIFYKCNSGSAWLSATEYWVS